jgi:hypothetical protein
VQADPPVRPSRGDVQGRPDLGLTTSPTLPLPCPSRPCRAGGVGARSSPGAAARTLDAVVRPTVLLEPAPDWARDPALGASVSNPCLIPARDGGWLLYHSASLAWIDDCGFCEPRYIALARGAAPEGPFRPDPAPIIDPDGDAAQAPWGRAPSKPCPWKTAT